MKDSPAIGFWELDVPATSVDPAAARPRAEREPAKPDWPKVQRMIKAAIAEGSHAETHWCESCDEIRRGPRCRMPCGHWACSACWFDWLISGCWRDA